MITLYSSRRNNTSNERNAATNATASASMDNFIRTECFKLIFTHGSQILNFSIIREGIDGDE